MHFKLLQVFPMVLLGLSRMSAAADIPSSRPADMVDYLIRQNEAARGAITSISYSEKSETVFKDADGDRHTTVVGDVIEKDTSRWSSFTLTTESEGRKEQSKHIATQDAKHLWVWPVGTGVANQFEIPGPSEPICPGLDQALRMSRPQSIWLYSAGDGLEHSLREVYTLNKSFRWEVEEVNADQGRVFDLKAFFKKAPAGKSNAGPVLVVRVDPAYHFCVTQFDQYDISAKGRSRYRESRISYTNITPQQSVPTDIQCEVYGTDGKLRRSQHIALQKVSLTPEVTADTFSIKALALTPKVMLITVRSDGQGEILVQRNGEFVPRDGAGALRSTEKDLKKANSVGE